MTRTCSVDLRERVVVAMLAEGNCREVAARFGVAPSSVIKWTKRFRETGSVVADKRGGHRRRLLESERDFIERRINECAHLTARGLRDELASRGVEVSHDTVWRFLRGLDLSHKKKPVRR
jgi:transposase